jgi:hypothetical protein
MDVDSSNYDEYIAGPPLEVITIETKIKPTNKGFAMLAKLGWAEGQPLGLSGDGRVDPIPFQVKRDLTGLGKTSQDVRMIETTVSQRRGLDSERQQKETEEQRKAREDSVARRTALQTEISDTLKAFYCTLCDKQFKTVAQYDEHTNSYAHHHKARFKDMQASQRQVPKEEVDKRKEKERKREEKELRKIAAAAGIKMAKPPSTVATIAPTIEGDRQAPPKQSGWASLTPATSEAPPRIAVQPDAPRSSWATVGSPTPATIQPHYTAPTPPASNSAPSFRTAGWTSLDTGSSQPFPSDNNHPPQPPSHVPPPPPPGHGPPPPAEAPPPAPTRGGWAPLHKPVSGPSVERNQPPAPPVPSMHAPVPQASPVPAPKGGRTGWQQFKQGGSKRK